MGKKITIVIAIMGITTLIAAFAVFGLNLFKELPKVIKQQKQPPYHTHLIDFLAGTELTHIPVVKNDFIYYELHTADKKLAGFVFLGTQEGWGGPINLFVKTDKAGIIQRVNVWHHTETPIYVVGLDAFLKTFTDYRAEAELIWQQDVHGITGATVTAKAIIAAVHRPGYRAHQKGIFIR